MVAFSSIYVRMYLRVEIEESTFFKIYKKKLATSFRGIHWRTCILISSLRELWPLGLFCASETALTSLCLVLASKEVWHLGTEALAFIRQGVEVEKRFFLMCEHHVDKETHNPVSKLCTLPVPLEWFENEPESFWASCASSYHTRPSWQGPQGLNQTWGGHTWPLVGGVQDQGQSQKAGSWEDAKSKSQADCPSELAQTAWEQLDTKPEDTA